MSAREKERERSLETIQVDLRGLIMAEDVFLRRPVIAKFDLLKSLQA